MSDEEKLRVEAAKRLERRRKKMENASTRLALITGQPESTIKLNDSYTIDSPASTSFVTPAAQSVEITTNEFQNGFVPSEIVERNRTVVRTVIPNNDEDPPLETLAREDIPLKSITPILPLPNYIWIFLAWISFILLESGHGYVIGHSAITIFILTVASLFLLNRINMGSSVGSIISTVLILCGLRASLVKLIIKSAEVIITVNKYFIVYFTTFLLTCQFYSSAISKENTAR